MELNPPRLELSSCDTEPIHVPGAIQPHGALVAFCEPEFTVVQASANVSNLLGIGLQAVLNGTIADVLGAPAAAMVTAALQADDLLLENPLLLTIRGRTFEGSVHRNRAAIILELEERPQALPSIDRLLRDAVTRLQRAKTVDTLCVVTANQIRALTGFDRAMVYRFHSDGHGEVVAEARGNDTDAFLGLHFPASDIPRQARQLYMLNPIRVIPDASYVAVPLVASAVDGATARAPAPLDLTFASLRGVSPIHLEYLANMGVAASMSVSIMGGDKLWGLIACHHREARHVPFVVRQACEVVGKLASLQIDALEERAIRAQREALRGGTSLLVESMRGAPDGWATALLGRSEELLRIVHATGAAVVDDEGIRTMGEAPTNVEIAALVGWLGAARGGAFATSALGRDHAAASAYSSVASGLLAVRVPKPRNAYLLWFRQEALRTVAWGGDPSKPVAPGQSDERLHPRKSFAAWKEVVRGTATPWTPAEIEIAEDLARRAIEVDLEQQIIRAESAVRTRDDLVAIVSHDLKNPLNVIQMSAQIARSQLSEDDKAAAFTALDRIERATRRMNVLISDLLNLAKIEAGRFQLHLGPCTARELVAEAVSLQTPIADKKPVKLDSSRVEDVPLVADRDRMFQVLTNLLGNAVKFSPANGVVTVSARVVETFVRFEVSDRGPGIPDHLLSSVFDRYWQAPKSRSRESFGLGLYIAKGIVDAHGGRIWVDSEVGVGTTFAFTVPVISVPEDRSSGSSLGDPAQRHAARSCG